MGIPSYFSHIIKNHIQVLKKYNPQKCCIDNLYMDCNSVIYDCVRGLCTDNVRGFSKENNNKKIYTEVCNKIQQYIDTMCPSNTVYIAFDGVAPLAKMDQQRSRRYKSAFLSRTNLQEQLSSFDTCQITPGTDFMNGLAAHLNNHYFNGPHMVIVSASDEPGEGEHKLFQYIRENPSQHIGKTTAIYGLDADLLMLSLFHQNKTNLLVLREAPEFAKSLNADLEPNALYALDINLFSASICTETGIKNVRDYAFLCFMLGNDFLPHFPAVNIRTHGIQHLMDAYKESGIIGSLIGTDGQIQWSNYKKIVKWLARYEEAWLKTEYLRRNDIVIHHNDDKVAMFNNVPLLYRATEHYINPTQPRWRSRYYSALFPLETKTKSVCQNYCEGLEWVYKYYTSQCYDWRWKYNYNYPPLLQDLAMYNPKNVHFIGPVNNPHTAKEQLAYVMPPLNNTTIPKFQWAWCKYFWEAHLVC